MNVKIVTQGKNYTNHHKDLVTNKKMKAKKKGGEGRGTFIINTNIMNVKIITQGYQIYNYN